MNMRMKFLAAVTAIGFIVPQAAVVTTAWADGGKAGAKAEGGKTGGVKEGGKSGAKAENGKNKAGIETRLKRGLDANKKAGG